MQFDSLVYRGLIFETRDTIDSLDLRGLLHAILQPIEG